MTFRVTEKERDIIRTKMKQAGIKNNCLPKLNRAMCVIWDYGVFL